MTPYNASNRKDIREAEKFAAETARQRLEFLTHSLSTTAGRAWFYDLLASCQCFVEIPTFNPNQDYHSAGRRSVGLQLLAEIVAHCPDQYILMVRESNARQSLADTRQRQRSPDTDGRDQGSGADTGGTNGYAHDVYDTTDPDLFDGADP